MPKTVLTTDKKDKPQRLSMSEYICKSMLDLLESKPLHAVKVRDLIEHAEISRSTFYAHFESLYDVIQKIEDDFFEDFYPTDQALAMMESHDEGLTIYLRRLVQKNDRTIRILCGPNGDPYFSYKIEKHMRDVCREFCKKHNPQLSGDLLDLRISYVAGATTALVRSSSITNGQLSGEGERELCQSVLRANDAMLMPQSS